MVDAGLDRGGGRRALARRAVRLAVVELGAEEAVPVLRRYYELARVTRPFFDVSLDSPAAEWLAEAPRHPVFRLRRT